MNLHSQTLGNFLFKFINIECFSSLKHMTSFENNNALAGNQQLTFIEGKLQFLPSSGLTCSKLEISNNRRGVHKV